ncbi:putative PD-(D/E)XK family protein DUF4420 [Motilibacter peucedani]|uniref:Putative PD-(D/E)XK family protein DUF4420 n=1 Tax=Motilibacter peucedani TaxID=598650 RepID=A0A420XRJ3_9ACTN|nr:PD-(D/E)XK motif protein [Motilibacter peucedani]RKS77498.1 putative PD-(D/E)XK family protein DUF4420 [Motilibacter peucedani]
MTPPQRSYEHQLELVLGLERPADPNERLITWCAGSGPVGLARDSAGHIEIFLEGPPLPARSRTVRDALEHQPWQRQADAPDLLASRLLLPAAGHYDQVAAFLCTELLRNGAEEDVRAAFQLTEPVIELALERLRIADRALLGLAGELLVLEALLRCAGDHHVEALLASWTGYLEAPRDFQVGDVGVEVKTTTRTSSSHLVQGYQQVDVGHGVDGVDEHALLLVSIGLEWAHVDEDESTSTTLPGLVEAILGRVHATMGRAAGPAVARLLANTEAYGEPNQIGYQHLTMATNAAYTRRFRHTFVRCYDMSDGLIELLREHDIRRATHVDPDSVRYRLSLPDEVRGDMNPVRGLTSAVSEILRRSYGGGTP